MPKITALIHASNDAARLGRALDSLRVCDQLLVVDHASSDATAAIAREHGATLKAAIPGVEPGAYVSDARHDWIFCLRPDEALGEGLEASLLEWKQSDPPDGSVGYCVELWHETEHGWQPQGRALRLVDRTKLSWPGPLPPASGPGADLPGEIRRFRSP
ncbi:MAG TPA: hypothetical protein VFA60_05005 [Terriglobales bacterium]|nr:hypothetical protein [Terriglobales bacterium]